MCLCVLLFFLNEKEKLMLSSTAHTVIPNILNFKVVKQSFITHTRRKNKPSPLGPPLEIF